MKLPFHEIDLAAGELRGATGEHVDLRPRSFAVLRVLAENAGSLVSKDEIIACVWDDVAVTEDSLTQCIAEIRKVIGDDGRRILRTVPRRGYLLAQSEAKADVRAQPPTLAVCPFRSQAGDKGAALALGVASEIINELARNRDLRLIARDSSFALAGQPARKARDLSLKMRLPNLRTSSSRIEAVSTRRIERWTRRGCRPGQGW